MGDAIRRETGGGLTHAASVISALAYGWLRSKLSGRDKPGFHGAGFFSSASDSTSQPSLRAEMTAKPA